MTGWKITGIISTFVIILAIPLYLLNVNYFSISDDYDRPDATNLFVGSLKCMDCHQKEYDLWQESHHDHAMDVAAVGTVLGDFDDATFEIFGVASRFYKKDDRFYVHTQGPGGEMGEFEITHVFGWYPLQQYLVPFSGGRLQCLPLAWDVREERWYHLYPDEPLEHNDWLYWTNAGQNWNGMCAECHSTNLQKNYDMESDSYQTTWSEIDVGCEACHGPGSGHVEWGQLPDLARPQVGNYELVVKTSDQESREAVELCAPCHSRRAILGDYTHAEKDLLDVMLPRLLTEPLYYADGQILDEVYVYGSFTQSKMYHRDVRCSDCHDVHSIKTVRDGNDLCLQCHRAAVYDTSVHHLHKMKGEQGEPIRSADGRVLFEVGTGAECVLCHMPGRIYMGNDYRPDHSFIIPRPDLSVTLGIPNACNRCHMDQTANWSDDYMTKWYGPGRRPHFGVILDAGHKRQPEAREELIHLAGDQLYPVIVRATAIQLLNGYTAGEDTDDLLLLALMDEEALIRRTALEFLALSDPGRQSELIVPMLYDPVRAVRIEAAVRLAGEPAKLLPPDEFEIYQKDLQEYMAAMTYSGDFPFGRFNLGNLSLALDQTQKATQHYRAAIRIDDQFYPARVNLAMLYNQLGENSEAETLLRQVIAAHPESYDVAYSLALLLAEMGNYNEAELYFERAVSGLPDRPRIHYNYGLLLQHLMQDDQAEEEMQRARQLEPDNLDFLYALADFYLKRGRLDEARVMAQEIIDRHPDQQIGYDILNHINQ